MSGITHMFKGTAAAGGLAVALSLAACGQQTEDVDTAAEGTAEDVEQAWVDFTEELANYSQARRDDAVSAIREELERMDSRLADVEDQLRGGWGDLNEDARQRREALIEELESRREALAEAFQKLRESSPDAWDELRDGFSNAWRDLGASLEQARSELASSG